LHIKDNSLGILFKFLLFFLGGIYLLRLISPFLFKLLISNLIKKSKKKNHSTKETSTDQKKAKPSSSSIGEYIDYEDIE
jgi:hypothetical protein